MKFKKFLILFITITFIFIISGCALKSNIYIIDREQKLDESFCLNNHLDKRILIIGSTYCKECQDVEKLIISEAKKKQYPVEKLDYSQTSVRDDIITSYNLSIRYIPAIIAGCNVYLGNKTLEQVQEILNSYKKYNELSKDKNTIV